MEACEFLNGQIAEVYEEYGITSQMQENPTQRFNAAFVLYNIKQKYLFFAGDCQAILGGRHYQLEKKIDVVNAEARSREIQRALDAGEATMESLLSMPMDEEPGRKLLLNPPGSDFPGLRSQEWHQNNPDSALGYFALDGFANFKANGFQIIPVPEDARELILLCDGYPVAPGQDAVTVLGSLDAAEGNLRDILLRDPMCFILNKGTKGKGSQYSFDDRAYLKMAL